MALERSHNAAAKAFPCSRCGRDRSARRQFVLGDERRCLACALRYAPMLRRSFYTALVVGTLLTAINQGSILVRGDFPPALCWEVPLTFCVPFCVAMWGALGNAGQRA